MAVEVLVMCGGCGRPQHAGREACVACGAKLPEAPAASPPPEQGAILEADPPFMEADLGRGRALALSRKRLEWRRGRGERPVLIELARLASVRLDRRPVFESLIFAVPALAALPVAASPLLRTALVALLLWAVAACFAQRRYVLRLRNDRGEQAGLLLGMGRPRAPRGMRIESVWSSLAQELRGLGVKVLPALLVLVASGCGYRFTAGGAPLPGGIRSVCAPVFTNQTAEPGLELLFTQALRERLVRAGVQGRGACEAQIQGELLSLQGGPTIVTPGQVLVSYRLQGTASLRLMKEGQVVSEAQVTGSEDYLPAGTLGDVLQMEASRQAALRRLVEAMARDGYERLASGW